MSSAELAARSVKELEIEDFEVLQALEKSVHSFKSVPLSRIVKLSHLHIDQVKFRLSKLNKLGFVIRSEFGYILLTAGLDLLALKALVNQGFVSGMGRSVGMGKESDVFEVINDSGENSVLKFYRIGRTSFRTTRKSREYVSPDVQHQWLTINMAAALKEEEGLKRALDAGVSVPRFVARNRHAVLMSEIEGTMIYRCRDEDIPSPKLLLKEIIDNVRKSYTGAHMINGDLSEYNVLFDGEKPYIIDWPQYVSINHVNAAEFLERDVQNIATYFRKRFEVKADVANIISYVSGKTRKAPI